MARRSLVPAEEGWNPNRRTGEDADLDITPMIDVTFLLLIFFMVSSTMQGTPDLDVPPTKHGVGVESATAVTIMVQAPKSPGETPVISFKGQPDATIDDVKLAVEDGIAADKTHVIIQADREVPHGFVQEITRAVTEYEGITFSIGVRDKD